MSADWPGSRRANTFSVIHKSQRGKKAEGEGRLWDRQLCVSQVAGLWPSRHTEDPLHSQRWLPQCAGGYSQGRPPVGLLKHGQQKEENEREKHFIWKILMFFFFLSKNSDKVVLGKKSELCCISRPEPLKIHLAGMSLRTLESSVCPGRDNRGWVSWPRAWGKPLLGPLRRGVKESDWGLWGWRRADPGWHIAWALYIPVAKSPFWWSCYSVVYNATTRSKGCNEDWAEL